LTVPVLIVGRKLPASAVNYVLSDNVTQELAEELFVSFLLEIQ
jgi:hypothetical protein